MVVYSIYIFFVFNLLELHLLAVVDLCVNFVILNFFFQNKWRQIFAKNEELYKFLNESCG